MKSSLTLLSVVLMSSLYSTIGYAQDAAKGKTLYATCIQCHGENGMGNAEKQAPRLSGQHDWYVVKQITEFKAGVRKNPVMLPYISNLSEQDIKDLAAYIFTL